jgi:hypothetical protein
MSSGNSINCRMMNSRNSLMREKLTTNEYESTRIFRSGLGPITNCGVFDSLACAISRRLWEHARPRVLAKAPRRRELLRYAQHVYRKACFGETPKPARETHALPNPKRARLCRVSSRAGPMFRRAFRQRVRALPFSPALSPRAQVMQPVPTPLQRGRRQPAFYFS